DLRRAGGLRGRAGCLSRTGQGVDHPLRRTDVAAVAVARARARVDVPALPVATRGVKLHGGARKRVSGRRFASLGEPRGPVGGLVLRDACFASSSESDSKWAQHFEGLARRLVKSLTWA